MKQEYCHAECEGGLDFVTQEKQEHNLWFWQTLENVPQF
jgi:putative component of membrane protein insertase Oxa1/YidC/SpoIIIJ protein YidD